MHDFLQDIRYALRGLRQKPLFALIAILSIAIGLGANASIFSIVNAMLLRPPAGIGHPERVVEIGRSNHGQGFDSFSYPELQDITSSIHSLDRVAGTRDVAMSFTGPSGAGERIFGEAVSAPYFEALGTTPLMGRFFTNEEDVPNTGFVAVVSHSFWKKHMGSRADAVGSTIELNRKPFTVIGVGRPGFTGHVQLITADVFVPLRMFTTMRPGFDEVLNRQASWLTIVGRTAPDATVDKVNTDLSTLFKRLAQQYPEGYVESQRSAQAQLLSGIPAGAHKPISAFLALLMGMVALVLLTTCANVAGMLLARAAGREREIAIRIAMGSGRSRLIRQLLVESLLLFSIGGFLGMLLSTWGMRLLSSVSLPVPVVLNLDFTPDARVFMFGLLLTLGTGALFGLAPALQSTKPNLVSALKNEGSAKHSRGGRLRRMFVMAQVSFSLVLLIAAGLFLRSLQHAAKADAGFNADGVRVMSFNLALDGYDDVRGKDLLRRLTTGLANAPGVEAAAATTDLPLDLSSSESPAYPEGYTGGQDGGLGAGFTNITPGYFDALRIGVLKGRAFDATDAPTSPPVVVVSKAFADKAWPGQDPIGKTLRWSDPKGPVRRVVGVVADTKTQTLMEEISPMVYMPLSQEYAGGVTLVVRSKLPPKDANAVMMRGIHDVDSKIALTPIQSLKGVTSIGILPQRMAAIISVSMGGLALLLSGMGIYGVIAYMVTQRTREIGVRVALGAKRRDVIGLVVRSGLRLALPGLLIGLAIAFGVSQLVRAFILGVQPLDPATFVLVPAVLLLMIAVATWVPAFRAARITPMSALRSD
jgi:predicted permease